MKNTSMDRYRLELSLAHVHRIMELTTDNEYKKFIYDQLIRIQVELQRQLTHYQNV